MNCNQFAKSVVDGPGGFRMYEDREIVVFKDRDVGIAEFVLRCLANPDCEGSQEALDAIIERRRERIGERICVNPAPTPPIPLAP